MVNIHTQYNINISKKQGGNKLGDNNANKEVIEAVKDKKQFKIRAVSLLLYQLGRASPKEATAISKELRRWYRKWI